MIGTQELETLIRLCLYSGYIKDEVPASVLILSEVEGGKCLAQGTRVLDPSTGAYIPIEAWRGQSVLSLTPEGKLVPQRCGALISSGLQMCYQLTTGTGRQIEATASHPFLTAASWKALQELKIGDLIAVPRILPCSTQAVWISERARLLGYLIGDGGLKYRSPEFTNADPTKRWHPMREIISAYAELLDSEKLRNWASSDILWDKVVSVKCVGLRHTFDLSVNGHHNFIAADIIVHNSELAKKFADNDGVAFPHDLTAYGIVSSYGSRLQPSAGRDRLRHIIFPEFIHCLERQKETVKTLLAFLNGLIAEGVKEIHTFKTKFSLPEPMSAGIIACLTTGEFGDWKDYWQRSGFLSRMLPITYSYSERVEEQIFESIFTRDYRQEPPVSLHFPYPPVDVNFPQALSRQLNPTAKAIGVSCAQLFVPPRKLRGFRGQVVLQRLAMGAALAQGRDQVIQADVDLVNALARKYANFNFVEI